MYSVELKAIILSVEDNNYESYDAGSGAGSYPERTDFIVRPLNCSSTQFADAILSLDEAIGQYKTENHFSDIGGSKFILKEGHILSISWETYFSSWLESAARHHLNALQVLVDDALKGQESSWENESEVFFLRTDEDNLPS